MKNVFKLEIPLYHSTIWLYINPTYEDIKNSKVKYFKDVDRNLTRESFRATKDKYSGQTFYDGLKMRILLYNPDKNDLYDTIPHEASHAAQHILEYIGVETIDTEVFAYLIGHITKFCFNSFDKYIQSIPTESKTKEKV